VYPLGIVRFIRAILAVQRATAEGIRLINEAAPSKEVIAIKSLEAFEKAADGKATKIIIPSEIQSLAGLTASLREIAEGGAEADASGEEAK
jgi:regulator of protease activity HflC (stomatin/prohibitin superfamily)